jgi:NAD(P)-dependent dehydrogenase (short-subunit alcohol dehydrogenase family)
MSGRHAVRIVAITGGAGGIGQATVESLAREGARIASEWLRPRLGPRRKLGGREPVHRHPAASSALCALVPTLSTPPALPE